MNKGVFLLEKPDTKSYEVTRLRGSLVKKGS